MSNASPAEESVTITVTSPVQDQVVGVGDNITITWNTTGPVDHVSITLFTYNGGYIPLSLGISNDGIEEFPWLGFYGTSFYLRVTDQGTGISGYSGYFTLGGERFLKVTSPNEEDYYAPGDLMTITWDCLDAGDTVTIILASDAYPNGYQISWTLASNIPNTGSFEWTVFDPEQGNAFNILVMGSKSLNDGSGWFSIKGHDLLWTTAPGGGEAWQIGSQNIIGWEARGTVYEIGIDLYRDGVLCYIIENATPSTWSYLWTIPDLLYPGDGYQIHVFWTKDHAVAAVSPYFTILGKGNATIHAGTGFDIMVPDGWAAFQNGSFGGMPHDLYMTGPIFGDLLTNILVDSGMEVNAIGYPFYFESLANSTVQSLWLSGFSANLVDGPHLTDTGPFLIASFTINITSPASITSKSMMILSKETGRFWQLTFTVSSSQFHVIVSLFDDVASSFSVTSDPPIVLDITRHVKGTSFSMPLPVTWSVQEDASVGGIILELLATGPVNYGFQANINVVSEFNSNYIEDPTYMGLLPAQALGELRAATGSNITMVGTAMVTTISGHAAVVFTVLWPETHIEQMMAIIIEEGSHVGYSIVCSSNAEAFSALQPTFVRVIEGFRLNSAQPLSEGRWYLEDPDPNSSVWRVRVMAVDGAGHSHLCYVDMQTPCLNYATDASGTWTVVQIATLNNNSADVAIAVDALGRPHISYVDIASDEVVYVTMRDGAWDHEIVEKGGSWCYPSIALSANGGVYLTYISWTDSIIYAAHKEGNVWQRTPIGGALGYAYGTGLAVDSSQHLYVSYIDMANHLVLATNASGVWTIEIVDANEMAGQYSVLRLDSWGYVHICYVDNYQSSLKYAENSLGTWAIETLDSSGSVNSFGSMSLDSVGRPHVIYARWTDAMLRYGVREATGWTFSELADIASNGYQAGLALDGHDHPRIAFANTATGQIMLARMGEVAGMPLHLEVSRNGSMIYMAWEPAIDDGGLPLIGFSIYRGTSPDAMILYQTIDASTNFMDQNVTLGLTYYYRIAERNAAGAGPQSSSVSILLATVPGAPRDLQMIREDARANLSWLQPSMDGGLAVTGYSIYRSIGGGQETLFISINATSYVDSDLINGQQYSYRIKAINAIGEGAYSTGGSVVPGTIPSAPRNLTIEVRDNMVHIDWSSGLSDGGYSVREYVIYRGSSSSELTELSRISNATTYLDANVTEGNSYYYIVSASNELGESPTSSIATATVPSSNTLSLILIIAVVLSAMAIGYVVLKRRKR